MAPADAFSPLGGVTPASTRGATRDAMRAAVLNAPAPAPGSVKVTVNPVRTWTLRDNASRDASIFLRDCSAYASASKQDIYAVIGASLNEHIRPGYEAIQQELVSSGVPSLDAALQAFAEITGRDLHEPRREAMAAIDKGKLCQERDESVAEYAAHMRGTHAMCKGSLSDEVVFDRFVEGLFNPQLRHECRAPYLGGYWTSLKQCVDYAVAMSHALAQRGDRGRGSGPRFFSGGRRPSFAGVKRESHSDAGAKRLQGRRHPNPNDSNKRLRGGDVRGKGNGKGLN